MAKDELQQHLDKGRYGSPRINPEEQRKYLGTFRERCFVSMTIREMKNNQDRHYLIEEIKKHPEGKLLINGAVPDTLQSEFIGLASKTQQILQLSMMRLLRMKKVLVFYWSRIMR